MKVLLVCENALKTLNLEDYKAYINNVKEITILALEKESPIDATFLWLTPDFRATTTFQQALMDLLKLQFVSSPGLSDKSHNHMHMRKVITLNKAFNNFPRAYSLNTLFLPLFWTTSIKGKLKTRLPT